MAIVGCAGIISGDDKMANVWEPFSKWYEWKKTTDLNEKQRAVVEYFDKMTDIKEMTQSDSFRDLPPEDALKVIKDSINMLKKTEVPKVCASYHNALLQEIKIEREYQEAKIAGASETELHKITLKITTIDGKKFTAFFDAIEKAGLTENLESELQSFDN